MRRSRCRAAMLLGLSLVLAACAKGPSRAELYRQACAPAAELEAADPQRRATAQASAQACEAALHHIAQLQTQTSDAIARCMVHEKAPERPASSEEVLACLPARKRAKAEALLREAEHYFEAEREKAWLETRAEPLSSAP